MNDVPKSPVFVLVPGGAMTPSAYGSLLHLLQVAGYGAISALLPSVGSREKVTIQDDADFVRNRMVLPLLDNEKRDVIVINHSYSGLPGGAGVRDLGQKDRVAQGKTTAVLGQIYITAVLAKGGEGNDLVATFGGQLPPHIRVDEAENLVKCDDPRPPLFQDVEPTLANAAVLSSVRQSYTAYTSPIPPASWDQEAYRGRLAYIRTLNDQAIPLQIQDMLLQSTAQDWVTRDMETGHCPQLVQPEKLSQLVLELAKDFESK